MKNTFAVTMTLLLALTIGGSIAGYRIATTPHHAAAEHGAETHGAETAATGTAASTEAGMEASTETTAENTTTESAAEGAEAGEAQPEAQTDTTAATDGVNNSGNENDTNTNEPGSTGNSPEDMAAAQPDTNKASASGDAQAGNEKYAGACAGCHGTNAEGGVGPALGAVKDWSLEDFTTALREGRTPEKTLNPTMPRFVASQVTDQDIANIHEYLKTK